MTNLQATAFIVAVGLSLYVVLAYEPEKKRLQGSIEEIWVLLDDLNSRNSAWLLNFLRVISKKSSDFLDALYGDRLFSLTALCISIALCSLTFYLFPLERDSWSYVKITIAIIGSAVAYRFGYLRAGLYTAGSLCMLRWLMLTWSESFPDDDGHVFLALIFVLVFVAAAVDIVAIAASRSAIRKAHRSASTVTAVFFAFLGCVATPAILFAAGALIALGLGPHAHVYGVAFWISTAIAPALTGSAVFLLILLLLLVYRVAMEILPRAVYYFIELRVISSPKVLLAASSILFGIAHPESGSLIEKVMRAVGGGGP